MLMTSLSVTKSQIDFDLALEEIFNDVYNFRNVTFFLFLDLLIRKAK